MNATGNNTFVIPFHHRATVASILIALTVIGICGNGLVIVSVIVTKKLRTVTNILVVNLAFADLATCLIQPFLSLGLLSKAGRYPLHEEVCAAVAGAMFTCICCSASTLFAIAVLRWYVITRSVHGHRGIHAPRKVVLLVIIIWIYSLTFIVLPTVLGVRALGYSKYYRLCLLVDSNLFYIYSQGSSFVIGFILIVLFYILILRHVLRHNRQIRNVIGVVDGGRSFKTDDCATSSVSREGRPLKIKGINKMEIEITKNLFIVVCVIVICFLTHIVNLIIPGQSIATLYSYMILLTNSVVNPIIYGLKHPNFQEAFKSILCRRQLKHDVKT
ncbi:rhodopsin, GQ-coupled-like [Lytechinus pictus]|uniref:rhodopsin, GQ-coupled-like n=1 Tax=Lytechinus pictus TaxID=7653 RepID=UPI00240DECE7|nr:rhodopsin, GQ-coupled-like [Lytechinus pictus]